MVIFPSVGLCGSRRGMSMSWFREGAGSDVPAQQLARRVLLEAIFVDAEEVFDLAGFELPQRRRELVHLQSVAIPVESEGLRALTRARVQVDPSRLHAESSSDSESSVIHGEFTYPGYRSADFLDHLDEGVERVDAPQLRQILE